jgi:hypothetical protein
VADPAVRERDSLPAWQNDPQKWQGSEWPADCFSLGRSVGLIAPGAGSNVFGVT